MKKIAFLTSERVAELLPYDREAAALLSAEGHEVFPLVWDGLPMNDLLDRLEEMDLAVVRTIWGYHEKPGLFLELLEGLAAREIHCWNPAGVMLQNMDKEYLAHLSPKGIDAIPTRYLSSPAQIRSIYEEVDWEEVVIKPAISAGSKDTWRSSRQNLEADIQKISESNSAKFMVQPFMPEVVEGGEYSYIFFSNGYRYAVRKQPKEGDYRVQVQFGGSYEIYHPDFEEWQVIAEIRDRLDWEFLYMRIDGVWVEGAFLVMEIEMIEPDLYLNVHPEGIGQFARAILEKLTPQG